MQSRWWNSPLLLAASAVVTSTSRRALGALALGMQPERTGSTRMGLPHLRVTHGLNVAAGVGAKLLLQSVACRHLGTVLDELAGRVAKA